MHKIYNKIKKDKRKCKKHENMQVDMYSIWVLYMKNLKRGSSNVLQAWGVYVYDEA